MIGMALASLRTRALMYAGAFVTLAVGTTIIATMTIVLWSVSSAISTGPQRYADAPAVVTSPVEVPLIGRKGGPQKVTLTRPAPLPEELVSSISSTGRVIFDRTFPAQVVGGPDGQVGHPWSTAALGRYRLAEGRAPASAKDIVIGGGQPSQVGSTVRLIVDGRFEAYRVAGVTEPVRFEHGVFFTDDEAARLSPPVDAVIPFDDLDRVRTVAEAAGAEMLTGDRRVLAERDQSGGRDQLWDAEGLAGTSLMLVTFVVVFVVVGTFAFVVDQRRREVALLRMVGGTPRQVRAVMLLEAVLLAVLACAIGCAGGRAGAELLRDWMVSEDIAPSWLDVTTGPFPLAIAFLLGVGSAVVATVVATWRAGRVRPAELLREAAQRQRSLSLLRALLGFAALVFGIYKSLTVIERDQAVAFSMQNYLFVPVLIVGGCALLAPLLVAPVVWVLTRPATALGASAMLVRENARFAAQRTSAIATPAVLAIGLGAALFGAQQNVDGARLAGLRAETRAELVVTAQGGGAISKDMHRRIAGVDEVVTEAYTSVRIELSQDQQYLGSLPATAVDGPNLTRVRNIAALEGSPRGLGVHSLVLDEESAAELKLDLDESVEAWLPDGSSARLRVAGITRTGASGQVAYISADIVRGFQPTEIEVAVTRSGDPEAAKTALEQIVKGQPLEVSPTAAGLSHEQAEKQRRTGLAVNNILGIAVAFALFAVINSLVMAAPGRRQELRTLNLAGVTRRTMRTMLAAEAVLAVIAGLVVGGTAAIIVVVGHYLALSRLVDGLSPAVPWGAALALTVTCAGVAVITSVASSPIALGSRVDRGSY